MQIDTKDILFICGGAFIDLEKTISERYFVLNFFYSSYFANFNVSFNLYIDDKILR